jgi:hypothetical protein
VEAAAAAREGMGQLLDAFVIFSTTPSHLWVQKWLDSCRRCPFFLPKDQNCCFPAATKWSGDLIKGGWHSQWDQNLVHEELEMACEYCTI